MHRDYHVASFCAWREFEDHLASGRTIDASFTSLHEKEIEGNRHYIKQLARVLSLTARQKIAQRGHKEDVDSPNRGNFLEILELLGDEDNIVKKHLKGKKSCKILKPKDPDRDFGIVNQNDKGRNNK